MATSPTYLSAPKNGKIQILPADTSGLKTIITAGASGSKVVALLASSTDTSARDVTFGITNGGTFYALGTKTIPITAGTVAGTPSVNLLDPSVVPGLSVDNDGNPYLLLLSGDTLQAQSLTTVTTAKLITLVAIYADF